MSEPSKRDAERALRDAGFSARQAKRLVAAGWPALGRADDEPDLVSMLHDLARRVDAMQAEPPPQPAEVVESSYPLACDRDDPGGAPADRSDRLDCA